jgi:phosphatidylinositol 3-kinase
VHKRLLHIGLDLLSVAPEEEFKCYIPVLVYNLINLDEEDYIQLSDYLIGSCINNYTLLNALYWELQIYVTTVTNKHHSSDKPTPIEHVHECYIKLYTLLKEVLSTDEYKDRFVKLMQGNHFVNSLNSLSQVIGDGQKYNDVKDRYNLKHNTILPLIPSIEISSMRIDQIKVKNSATRPIIIPCITTTGETIHVMHKNESVRKDQIILNIINLLTTLVYQEEGIDLDPVRYNILPINKQSGLIEIVEKCDTIYYVKETLKATILNYILEDNDGIKINELKTRFVKTTALYSVITYLLGVGDRHLDNIMITKDGRLFHIDFDYILGDDPVFNNNSAIRITPEMIDAIGGVGSKYYVEFKEMCTKIFNCARRNINVFINMINILPKISDVKLTEAEITDQIIKRFLPGENDLEANLYLVNRLEKQNYTDRIKDWCHYHSKERTVGSVVEIVSNAVQTTVTSVLSMPFKESHTM